MFENVPVSRRERRGKRWSGMVLCSLYEALDGEGEEEGSRGGRSVFVPPQSERRMGEKERRRDGGRDGEKSVFVCMKGWREGQRRRGIDLKVTHAACSHAWSIESRP